MLHFRGTSLLFYNEFLNAPLLWKVSSLLVAVVHIPSRPGCELQQLRRREVDFRWVSDVSKAQEKTTPPKRKVILKSRPTTNKTNSLESKNTFQFSRCGISSNSMDIFTGADETTTPHSSRPLLISGLWCLEDLRLGRGKQSPLDSSFGDADWPSPASVPPWLEGKTTH